MVKAKCPKCGGDGVHDNTFYIAVHAFATLDLENPHNPQTYDVEGDHEWDDDSALMCSCGWVGRASDAITWEDEG